MQNIYVLDQRGNKSKVKAKYHIGQRVFIIQYHAVRPLILEGWIISIGVSSIYQLGYLVYSINRDLSNEPFKRYYEKDVFRSRTAATKVVREKMKKDRQKLKDLNDLWKNVEKPRKIVY